MSLANQFETLLNSAKQVEDALAQERARSRKIADEYIEVRKKYEANLKLLQQKLKEKDYEIENMKDLVADAKIAEEKLKNHVLNMSMEEKKLRDELSKFEESHDELMERDNQARAIMLDNGKLKQTIAQLSAQIQGAHEKIIATREMADQAQKQFQSMLARAQAAEGIIKRQAVELQQAVDAKSKAEHELRTLAPMMREQAEKKIATEREKARFEIYQEMAGKLERIRDDSDTRIRSIEEKAAQKVIQVEAERDRLFTHLKELSQKATEQLERARKQVETAESARLQIATQAQQALDAARFDASKMRLEMENLKKETNRVLILERLKHQKESEALKAQIQSLQAEAEDTENSSTVTISDDLTIEKWTRADLPHTIAIARPLDM